MSDPIEQAILKAQAEAMDAEVQRRYLLLERVLNGIEAGHVFVEFSGPEVVELALGGPGRRVDLGEPDAQGFYTPTVWAMGPVEVDEPDPTGILETGTGG